VEQNKKYTYYILNPLNNPISRDYKTELRNYRYYGKYPSVFIWNDLVLEKKKRKLLAHKLHWPIENEALVEQVNFWGRFAIQERVIIKCCKTKKINLKNPLKIPKLLSEYIKYDNQELGSLTPDQLHSRKVELLFHT